MLEEAKRDAAEMSAAPLWWHRCRARRCPTVPINPAWCAATLFGRSADGKGLPLDTDAACAWLRSATASAGIHLAALQPGQHRQRKVAARAHAPKNSTKACTKARARPASNWPTTPDRGGQRRAARLHVRAVRHLHLVAERGAQIVISARRKPLRAVDSLRNAVRNGEPIRSSVELLTHLLRDQADALIKIVRDAITTVDSIEDNLLAGKLTTKRASLGALRRVLVRLQRLLAPEPAALFRLLQKPPAWMAESDVQELRQSTEEFSMVLADMASLQERIKLIQEEIAALASEANNHSLFVLTVVTVLALPINIIAGLLGMNVGGSRWRKPSTASWSWW
jgi:zinc transporter